MLTIIKNPLKILWKELNINFDSIVDILDIILVINQIFINDYSDSADINSDLVVDILDIMAILNILLEN